MAKRDNNKNYFQRKAESEEKAGQLKYNLQQSFIEQLGGATDYEIATPIDAYKIQTAPTLSPDNKRTPRAEKIAYSVGRQQLVVKFYNGPWWYYNGITPEQWNSLKTSSSTGGWLHQNGLNSWDDMGPFDPSEMSRADRVRFNS